MKLKLLLVVALALISVKGDLEFIDKNAAVATGQKFKDSGSFTPTVMSHNDARDVLRKLVKEKDTAFVVQFYKGAPDRALR